MSFNVVSSAETIKGFIDVHTVFNSKQKVIVQVNGKEVFNEDVADGLDIEFEFLNDSANGEYEIKILLPEAISPKELGQSSVNRTLALAISKLYFTEN